ncbi:MAG: Z1 domain-containing protein [Boseongicola sp.]|nr:Z1 domain-containing protein [Boseongicola sp.]
MPSLDAELAYFRQRLFAQLEYGQPLPTGTIEREVRDGPFGLNEEQQLDVIRQLEGVFTTTQTLGASILSDYKPWLQQRRGSIDFFYWNRLNQFYISGGELPPSVVSVLDNVTDEVLDYCGDPEDLGAWARRGMVMGHVQSGKTTNYAALICKAADAGYKVVILLAGITNSLRAQTQERLDETFIGKVSVFSPATQEELPITSFGTGRFPAYGTSRDNDFSKNAASTYGVTLSALKEPIIFVTKKNKSTLERLRDWLKDQNRGAVITEPLLLIDDEADNASINTSANPDRVTAINRAIREILQLFQRSSYVGYTATPFANIFIDPDTEDEMLQDDLFPRHFIKALDPPSNYVGASRVFETNGDLKVTMVRVVEDYRDILPLKHKRDHELHSLPPSMKEAIRVFLLTRAIRILRNQGSKHCSMMVNVSRFNDVQEGIHGLVYAYLVELRNSLTVNGGLPLSRISDKNIEDLSEDFQHEFRESGYGFGRVLKTLCEAASSVSVTTVNMRGGTLDYSRHKDGGLHVIAIGGLALSRGLTLEGLTVSYILRNTAASDTLMQMARWFGYRTDYEDICRLYLPESSLSHYEYVEEAIEELRDEVNRMESLNQTPEDFGLKVRQSPTALRITAANKMRAATSVTLAQDYSGRHIEGHVLFNDDGINRENSRKVAEFLQPLGAPQEAEYGVGKHWPGVDGTAVLGLLEEFRFPPHHLDLGQITGGRSLFRDYVGDRVHSELEKWDVVVPHRKERRNVREAFGLSIPLRSRERGDFRDVEVWRATGDANRIADPLDARLLLSEQEIEEAIRDFGSGGDRAFCRKRGRPLLLIHVIGETGSDKNRKFTGPAVSLSFCLPKSRIPPEARSYQVNTVYRRQLELALEPDDDEEEMQADDRHR